MHVRERAGWWFTFSWSCAYTCFRLCVKGNFVTVSGMVNFWRSMQKRRHCSRIKRDTMLIKRPGLISPEKLQLQSCHYCFWVQHSCNSCLGRSNTWKKCDRHSEADLHIMARIVEAVPILLPRMQRGPALTHPQHLRERIHARTVTKNNPTWNDWYTSAEAVGMTKHCQRVSCSFIMRPSLISIFFISECNATWQCQALWIANPRVTLCSWDFSMRSYWVRKTLNSLCTAQKPLLFGWAWL